MSDTVKDMTEIMVITFIKAIKDKPVSKHEMVMMLVNISASLLATICSEAAYSAEDALKSDEYGLLICMLSGSLMQTVEVMPETVERHKVGGEH